MSKNRMIFIGVVEDDRSDLVYSWCIEEKNKYECMVDEVQKVQKESGQLVKV